MQSAFKRMRSTFKEMGSKGMGKCFTEADQHAWEHVPEEGEKQSGQEKL